MRAPMSYTHAAALLLTAALVSCSHGEKKAAPPPPAAKPTAAEESQKSFQLAAQEQRELADQQKRVEAARAATVAAQQQLAKAQAQEQQERAKAQQLQERASQHLQEGVAHAQQAQVGAAGAGGGEGLQTVAGTVAQATPSHVVIQTASGQAMSFAVDGRTRVLVGTESRPVTDIQRGADAQVAYDPRPGQMTALIIRVMPAGSAGAASPAPERADTPPRH